MANRTNFGLRGSIGGRRVQCALAAALAMGAIAGCKKNPEPQTQATIIDNNSGANPAAANLASVDPNAPMQGAPAPTAQPRVRVLGQQLSYPQQQTAEEYPQQQPYQQPYQDPQQQPYQQPYPQQPGNGQDANGYPDYDAGVNQGYDALEQADQPPPPLPVYQQPPAPEPDDLWTPGYWGNGGSGYYWVPGAWVAAPYAGALWTPGYWGYAGNRYRFHRGFWARHIGFYGGINYGFGYSGTGYEGGYWNGEHFYYNREVNRVNYTNIHNVYDRRIEVNNVTRISYNGGNGGLRIAPRPQELAVLREQRIPAMATQTQFRQEAARNPQQFYNQNHGQPAQFAVNRPVAAVRGIQAPPAQQQIQQQQRFQQSQQQNQGNQQRLAQEQQRNQQAQQADQRNAQVQEQQRNLQMQQQQQQRNQQLDQRNVQQQQRNAQEQQRNAQEQQRNAQEQQHNVQEQQRNAELQQRNAQQQQQQQRNAQQQQQQEQQRNLQMQQQRNVQQQQQQHPVQQQQAAPPAREQHVQPQQPQPQHVQPQAQPQPQRMQPQAQPQPQHVQPQPQPQRVQPQQVQPHPQPMPQQHAAPAPQPHQEPPHAEGGGRPR